MYFVIVLLVTGEAIGWRVAEKLCLVAFLAFHFHMQAKQRKACTPMVYLGVLPVFFVMAGFAALTQLVLVHIVFFVASDAILFQFLLIKIARMASDTFNLLMLAL